MESQWLTVNDVARIVRRTTETVRNWERAGRLEAIRTAGGIRLFRREAVARFVAARDRRKVAG